MTALVPLPLGETFTLSAGNARLVVAPQCGARLVSFDIGGLPVLRPLGAAAGRHSRPYDFAGFPLLPYSGSMFGGGFDFENKRYRVGRTVAAEPDATHGDAWTAVWSIETKADASATLGVTYQPEEGRFPFAWAGKLSYTVTPDALEIVMHIVNGDRRAMPAGMGFHPYFPRPEKTRLRFGHGEVWPPDAADAVELEPQLIDGLDFNHGRDVTGMVVDRCFERWDGMAAIDYPDGRRTTITASPEFGKMQIYLPWYDPFLCVEPVSNANDGFNRARHGVLRHGVTRLAPGETLGGTIRIAMGAANA